MSYPNSPTTINNLDPMKPTYWSRRNQALLRTRNIARQICSFEERANLSNGQAVNRPRPAEVHTQDLAFNSGVYERFNRETTQETLTIDMWKNATLTYTKDQMIQMRGAQGMVNGDIDRAAFKLNLALDREVNAEVINAGHTTAAATYTKADIYDGMGEMHAQMRNSGVEMDRSWYFLGDADVTQIIQNSLQQRQTGLGDANTPKNYMERAKNFAGFRVYESVQNLYWTGQFNLPSNPADGETLVIDGVTITFQTAVSVAGGVLIGATAPDTVANLAALVNDPLNTAGSANYQALGTVAAGQFKAPVGSEVYVQAVDNTTYVEIQSFKGRITLAEDFSTNTDNNLSNCVLHCMCGRMGNVDLVLQSDLQTNQYHVDGTDGSKDYVTSFLAGIKTFTEGAERMGDFRVQTQSDTPSV